MKHSTVCVIIGLTTIAEPVIAAPIYLKCMFPGSNGDWPVDITADETDSSVTVVMPVSGRVDRLRGAFGPDTVIFGNSQIRYTLSRTDLTVLRETPLIRQSVLGKCKIEIPPKRAF